MKINVLGTQYSLVESSEQETPRLAGIDGFCDTSTKECVVDRLEGDGQNAKANLPEYKKCVARHELIHAFLFESGLDTCRSWARNEEMVDWLAIQFPKLLEAFKAADAL